MHISEHVESVLETDHYNVLTPAETFTVISELFLAGACRPSATVEPHHYAALAIVAALSPYIHAQRLPARFTLFPYTTLFRSGRRTRRGRAQTGEIGAGQPEKAE